MDTKDLIIMTAKELFLSKGYKKTTTREIAEKASVNLGLIPYYFKNKENLARTIYQEIMRDIIDPEEIEKYPAENAIQRFFIYYVLVQHNMLSRPGVFQFYIELIYEDVVAVDAQEYTYELARQVMKEYDLMLSEEELDICTQMMKGVERKLTVKKLQNKLNLSHFEINALLVLNLLLTMGIDKDTIERETEKAKKIVFSGDLDPALLQ